MRIKLNEDGTINALGSIQSYPFAAPDFITQSNHLRWKCLDFENFSARSSWVEESLIVSNIDKKLKAIQEGQAIILEFLSALEQVSLDTASYIAVTEQFKYVEIALQRGDLIQAAAQANSIPVVPGSLIWSQTVKSYFVALIESKVN